MKLLAYSAAVTVASLIVLSAIYLAGFGIGSNFWVMPVALGFGIAVPIACGVAILRHGLYDIDRLISRTVSYSILTGLLVSVFAAIVVLTTRLLPFTSSVGVAMSTLVAAALFNPLRRQIQRRVDRRFNRAHYDAQSTVAAFGSRLRDAVDGDTICGELLEAADQTLARICVYLDQARRLNEPPLSVVGTDECKQIGGRASATASEEAESLAAR